MVLVKAIAENFGASAWASVAERGWAAVAAKHMATSMTRASLRTCPCTKSTSVGRSALFQAATAMLARRRITLLGQLGVLAVSGELNAAPDLR
jgi:hypothetical protein